MLFALFLLASSVADLVPMRWVSADPVSLQLLENTPINCLLLRPGAWSDPLTTAARQRKMTVLGVISPGDQAMSQAQRAASLHLDGVVLEGDFPAPVQERLHKFLADSKVSVIDMPSRAKMRFDERPIVATNQSVWPGIQAEEEGHAKAAPSGGPWINTNGGFLRFARAAAPDASIWLGNLPPKNTVITPEHYVQAIADAAIIGARWIIALDDDFQQRLLKRESNAVRDWQLITSNLAWFEQHKEWRELKPVSELAILQDVDSGALYSGGVLDMIAVKHTPVRPIPSHSLKSDELQGIAMAVDVDPSSLTPEQKAALTAFRRRGGSTLSAPATWKFPPISPEQITLNEQDVKTLDEIWKETNQMTGRRNLGVRLFNVSSMLSNLAGSPDGKREVLFLVNYSGYPVENVTVHLLGKYQRATLLAPGEKPKNLAVYEVEEGTGTDIDTVHTTAAVVLEK